MKPFYELPAAKGQGLGFWNSQTVKDLDRGSIRAWVEHNRPYFTGRVLDYGCGEFAKPEDLRYRDVMISNGAEYFPYDPQFAPEWPDFVSGPLAIHQHRVMMERQLNATLERSGTLGVELGCFDAILCTQVLQDCADPPGALRLMSWLLKSGGNLVLTYGTCWREVDVNDKFRFTFAGMEDIIRRACPELKIIDHVRRAQIKLANYEFSLGGGIICKKR